MTYRGAVVVAGRAPGSVVERAAWGARHEDGHGRAAEPAREAWLHHTVALMPGLEYVDADRDGVDDDEAAAMRQLEAIGEQRFGRGVSYNRVVAPSGVIYAGVSFPRQGAHLRGRNRVARSWALMGNYDTHHVTSAQVYGAAVDVVEAWRHGHLVNPWLDGCHRQAPGAATACAGRWGCAAVERINAVASLTLRPEVAATPTRWNPEEHAVPLVVVHPNGAARLLRETANGSVSHPITSNRARKAAVKSGAVEVLCDSPTQFAGYFRNLDPGDPAEYPTSNR